MKLKCNENRPLKVAYSPRHSGFILSEEAENMLGINANLDHRDPERHHPKLIEVIEKLGEKACGDIGSRKTKIAIHELSGKLYYIYEFDGAEKVIEPQDMIDASIYEESDEEPSVPRNSINELLDNAIQKHSQDNVSDLLREIKAKIEAL